MNNILLMIKNKRMIIFLVSILLISVSSQFITTEVEAMTTVSRVFNSDGVKVRDYSNYNDIELTEYPGSERAHSYIAVYLFSGDYFQFSAYKKEARDRTLFHTGEFIITDPNGVSVKLDLTMNYNETKSIAIRAETTGIHLIELKNTLKDSVGVDAINSFDLTIKIEDESGVELPGRVWFNNLVLWQSDKFANSGHLKELRDLTLYHVTKTGYIYKQELRGFNGLISNITSSPVGIVDISGSSCKTIYHDVPISSTRYKEAINSALCSSTFDVNAIFLEMPDINLPEKALARSSNGKLFNVYVNPQLNVPVATTASLMRVSFNSYAGEFLIDITDGSGNADLYIEIDDNKDGVVDRYRKDVVNINEFGDSSYLWDGRDDDGVSVPTDSGLNIRLNITKSGEIHFTFSDVETLEGHTVTRIRGIKASEIGDTILHYDASQLHFDFESSNFGPNFKLPDPIKGSYDSSLIDSTRNWFIQLNRDYKTYSTGYARLDTYPYIDASNPKIYETLSFGDGNVIVDYMFEDTDINFDLNLDVIDPKIEKVSLSNNVNVDKAFINDILLYTVVVHNNENYAVTDYTVVDQIPANVTLIPESLYLNGSIPLSDAYSLDKNTLTMFIPSIEADASFTIEFKVLVKSTGKNAKAVNIATLSKSSQLEQTSSVETKIIIKDVDDKEVEVSPKDTDPVLKKTRPNLKNKGVDESLQLPATGNNIYQVFYALLFSFLSLIILAVKKKSS